MLDVAVIIVSWNVKDLLKDCLESVLAEFERHDLAGKIWVIDNASTDGTPDFIKANYSDIYLIENDGNPGFGAANNQGIQAAKADAPTYYFLLNPDTIVHENGLKNLVTHLDANSEVGMVGPRLIYGDGSFQHSGFRFPALGQLAFEFWPLPARLYESRWNGRYPQSDYDAGKRAFSADCILGAAMLVRADVAAKTDGFDEAFFMYCEEIDWCWRIRNAGWDIRVEPSATVTHFGGESSKQIPAGTIVNLWTSRAQLYSKHHGKLTQSLAQRLVVSNLGRRAAEAESAEIRAAYEDVLGVWSKELGVRRNQSPNLPISQSLPSPTPNSQLPTPELTAVILTYNEEYYLPDCISSLKFADRIVVYDSHSDDKTVEIANEMGAELLQNPFENYAQQRNAALDAIETDWVLFVDADERVTAESATEIRAVTNNLNTLNGYHFPRHNFIFGKLTKGSGWFPDYQARLFKHGTVRYESPVHERAVVDGELGHLSEPLIHYNYRTIEQFYEKNKKYSTFDAHILQGQGVQPKAFTPYTQAVRHFYWRFVTHEGYKDGLHGLRLSGLMGYFEYLKYAKLRGLVGRGK